MPAMTSTDTQGISDEQIAAAVRPLYADDKAAIMGLADDIRTARAVLALQPATPPAAKEEASTMQVVAWRKAHRFQNGRVDYSFTWQKEHADDWARLDKPLEPLVREADALAAIKAARVQALEDAYNAMFEIKGCKVTRFDAQTAIRLLGEDAGRGESAHSAHIKTNMMDGSIRCECGELLAAAKGGSL